MPGTSLRWVSRPAGSRFWVLLDKMLYRQAPCFKKWPWHLPYCHSMWNANVSIGPRRRKTCAKISSLCRIYIICFDVARVILAREKKNAHGELFCEIKNKAGAVRITREVCSVEERVFSLPIWARLSALWSSLSVSLVGEGCAAASRGRAHFGLRSQMCPHTKSVCFDAYIIHIGFEWTSPKNKNQNINCSCTRCLAWRR